MSIKIPLLAAASLAALALPLAASAQTWGWGGGDYYRGWGGGYGFSGYPQFQGEKQHIRAEIREGLSEGWLDRDQAGDFNRQLRFVQIREAREFREHGWSLPGWDSQSIRASLDQLDRAIDQTRDEGGPGYDRSYDRGYDEGGYGYR